MRLVTCGVRGSTPSPGADFIRYGGHTSCVAVIATGEDRPRLVLDAGTGIRNVTTLLGEAAFDGAILLTHLHWDHVQGLPFFRGGDRDDARVSLLVPRQPDLAPAAEVLGRAMSPPHFPIGPAQLRGDWSFGEVDPGAMAIGCFEVVAREVPHKGGRTFGYRVTDGHHSFAYIPDHCPTDLGAGDDGYGAYHPAAMQLATGVDLLIHDAQLLSEELAAEASFGHAAGDYAIGLAERAGARRVAFFHHSPNRTDAALDAIAARAASSTVPVMLAVEGMEIDL